MNVALLVPHYGDIYNSYRHLYRRGFVNPPMSLCYLASSLIAAGHRVTIIDGEAENLSAAGVISRTKGVDPQLIGLTATSIDFDLARQLAEVLKKELAAVPIVLGGTHVNIFGAQVLEQWRPFDYACIGDGEDLIVELAEVLTEKAMHRLPAVAGLIYRQDGQVVQNPFRVQESNIDRYPVPARHLLRNELYYRAVPPGSYETTAAVMSSRGCPYSCIYCAVKNIHGGTKVRLRSAENVLDELEHIVSGMGIRHIAFNDDCLTLDRQRILDLCDGIHQRQLKFSWEGLSRADLLDRDLLVAMRRAGFVRVSIGIESGNPEILKVLKKNESLAQIAEGIRMAKEAGIATRGSVIIGSPYETRETVEDTFRFINQLKHLDQVVINILQPYPGTKVREMVLRGEGGIKFYGSENSDANLQRFGRACIGVNDLSPERLVRLQRYGFLRFYMRPKVICNNIRMSSFKTFVSDSIGFLRSIIGY